MLSSIRRLFTDLAGNNSGNAMLLVALGMPVLIGSSGLAVDSAQYYMWKRDLQFAVDSAALAGAWARTSTTTASTYQARALQEYNANVQTPGDFDTGPTTTLLTVGGHDAVKVVASASKALPFSKIISARNVTVTVEALASAVAPGATVTTTTTLNTLTSCMIALDPSAMGAFTIGGDASGIVGCGGAALSTHPSAAIREQGNPSATFGSLVAGGGIEISLLNNVGGVASRLMSNTAGLTDPFGTLAQPTGSGVAQTYTCPTFSAGTATTTANASTVSRTVYGYYVGSNNNTTAVLTPKPTTAAAGYLADPGNSAPSTPTRVTVPDTTTEGAIVAGTQTRGTMVEIGGSGNAKQYRAPLVTPTTTYTGVIPKGSGSNDGIARPAPGTYNNISIACTTYFQPGIYVINGTIDFSANSVVTGSNMMLVMTAANRISNINSNINISLSGITKAYLMSNYGYTDANASKIDGMLFFDTQSDGQLKFNGNSTTAFNGIMYMPKRQLWFNGTSKVSGKCMKLVSAKITLDGTTDLSSFCDNNNGATLTVRPQITTTTTTVGNPASVKLIQ